MLEKMGEPRATPEDQRTFLISFGNKFGHLVNDAINGSYGQAFFGNSQSEDGYKKRLRAVIQNLNVQFAEDMRLKGHTRQIVEEISFLDAAQQTNHKPQNISRAEFCKEVGNNLKRSRGAELPGMFNPLVSLN